MITVTRRRGDMYMTGQGIFCDDCRAKKNFACPHNKIRLYYDENIEYIHQTTLDVAAEEIHQFKTNKENNPDELVTIDSRRKCENCHFFLCEKCIAPTSSLCHVCMLR